MNRGGSSILISVGPLGRYPTRWSINAPMKEDWLLQKGFKYAFIVNPNVHATGRRLRGLLVARISSIGVVLKASLDAGIYQALIPPGKPTLISLSEEGLEPLQQVLGKPLSNTFMRRGIRVDKNGFISMSPGGPDLKFVKTSSIPKQLVHALGHSDMNVEKQKLIKALPKQISTLYLLDSGSKRTSVGKDEVGKYWIPCSGGEINNNRWVHAFDVIPCTAICNSYSLLTIIQSTQQFIHSSKVCPSGEEHLRRHYKEEDC